MAKRPEDARDRTLKICRSEIAQWQKEIELMRAGKIIKHEVRGGRIVDTTKDSIRKRAVWIAEMEKTISKVESLRIGLSALWVALTRRSLSISASRELHRSAREQIARVKSLDWSRWDSARHAGARPGKRTANHRLTLSRSRIDARANGSD
jgi:hypothetical protein